MKKRTIWGKVFGLIALTAVIGFLATACPADGGINGNGGNGDNSGNNGNGGNGNNGGNNGNGDNGNGGDNGNNNANYRIIAYLGRDDNGTSYDLIITEPETASARVASPEGPSYRLVVTPRGETPRVSEGTAARTNGGIGLRSSRGGEAAVTLDDDELDGINGEISYEDGSTETVDTTLTPYNVYIAGQVDGPCYWNGKSRVDLPLPAGAYNAIVQHITVVNSDVYVAGYYTGQNDGSSRACYWKNGVRTDLTDCNYPPDSFTVDSSGNVYVNIYGWGVWVNNQKKITEVDKNEFINNDPYASYIYSITTVDTHIYAAGFYLNDTSTTPNSGFCYWKDGYRTALSVNGIASYQSIAVSKTEDVYVLGYTTDNTNQKETYCYWKNGIERTDLQTTGNLNSVRTHSIMVDSNNDVYVAGYDNGPCYWKNGVKTSFASSGGEFIAATASGGNVYAVSKDTDGPGYFVNGEFIAFENRGNGYWSTTICVVD